MIEPAPPSRPTLRSMLARPLTLALIRLAAVGAALLGVGLLLGLAVVGRHGGGAIQSWDDTVWHWSIRHRGPLIGIDKIIAMLGDAAALGPICIALSVGLYFWLRSPRALAPILAYLGGEGLVFMIRLVIHRRRPPSANYPAPGAVPGVHETSFSFPSGHAVAVTAVVFTLLGFIALTRRTGWPWLLAAAISGYVADSRLLLGVHWFSDVAIGLLLGISWGVSVAMLTIRLSWQDLAPHSLSRTRPAAGDA